MRKFPQSTSIYTFRENRAVFSKVGVRTDRRTGVLNTV